MKEECNTFDTHDSMLQGQRSGASAGVVLHRLEADVGPRLPCLPRQYGCNSNAVNWSLCRIKSDTYRMPGPVQQRGIVEALDDAANVLVAKVPGMQLCLLLIKSGTTSRPPASAPADSSSVTAAAAPLDAAPPPCRQLLGQTRLCRPSCTQYPRHCTIHSPRNANTPR